MLYKFEFTTRSICVTGAIISSDNIYRYETLSFKSLCLWCTVLMNSTEVSIHIADASLFLSQIAALQEAYDGLCMKRGTSAVPYFLMKYTDKAVQMAPLGDWDTFFTDTKKVVESRLFYLCCSKSHSCQLI